MKKTYYRWLAAFLTFPLSGFLYAALAPVGLVVGLLRFSPTGKRLRPVK